MVSVTKSPRLAAIGVATLSGLILKFLDKMIINIIRPARTKLANDAVDIQPAIRTRLFFRSSSCWFAFVTNFKAKAPTEAKKPTTIAWALFLSCFNFLKI